MRRYTQIWVIALMALGAALAFVPGAAAQYSGGLTSAGMNPGIVGTGVWIDPGVTTLDWTVNNVGGGLWHYSYTLSVPLGGVSHFIIEVSPNFTTADIVDTNWASKDLFIQTWSEGNGNPNMPEPFYGLKFNEAAGLTATFELWTYRVPVWGDFYSKDGTAGNPPGVFNTAFNAGFDSAAPYIPADQGPVQGKILVPDTEVPGNVIPEANTLALAAMGLASMAGLRARLGRRR